MEHQAFAHLIGNETAKAHLSRMVRKQAVGNSLLFAGPEGVGKCLFATAFAKLLFSADDPQGSHAKKIEAGTHPDVHVYKPEGKTGMHSIAAMRQFSEDVYLAPFEGKHKVFIIDDADRMLPSSANALLKTFEEPALDAVIILVTSAPASLLPTVLSRCRTVRFQPLSTADVAAFIAANCNMDEVASRRIASLAHGSLGKALRLTREGDSPMRGMLLDMLAGGGFSTYKQLTAMAEQIADGVDAAKKGIEEGIKGALPKGCEMSAVQKQALEKEVEGAIAVYATQQAYGLFDVIAGWFRDVQLISVNGNPEYLMHADYKDRCAQALQAGRVAPLEAVQKAIGDARLSLQRSTPIQTCFENLFLKLDLLR